MNFKQIITLVASVLVMFAMASAGARTPNKRCAEASRDDCVSCCRTNYRRAEPNWVAGQGCSCY